MLRSLWGDRECLPAFSKSWFKAWGKRIHSLPALFQQQYQLLRLRSRGACIGSGTVIVQQSIISGDAANVQIGEHTFVGRVEIAVHAPVTIGSHVCINDGVKLLTASHDVGDPHWRQTAGAIVIEDFVWVATDAIVLPNVRIGKGAVIGAAAVVTKDVPAYAVATGNPARIRENARARNLDYDPTTFLATQRAWLGNGSTPREVSPDQFVDVAQREPRPASKLRV